MKIDRKIFSIIEAGETREGMYYLPSEKLDRKTYLKVNKVLELLGGKWNRKEGAHVFETEVGDRIENLILTGEVVDKKKELQFFETPQPVAQQLCELADLNENSRVLEPSAGQGAIIREISRYTKTIYWAELDEENASKINIGKRIGSDFMNVDPGPEPRYINRIVMNPPFSRQQDIDHVTRALEFIDSGILVSVMSPSVIFRTNKKTVEFREMLEDYHHEIIDLPEESFKSSGTNVNTIILGVCK